MEKLQFVNERDNLRYRVICFNAGLEDKYYLQRKTLFLWQTMCGYNRGTEGYYSYDYDYCANPFAQVEHNLFDILQEESQHTINCFNRFVWWLKRPPCLKEKYIKEVYQPNDLIEAINVHRSSGYLVTNPYPRLSSIIKHER
jgi:hypothetical protein